MSSKVSTGSFGTSVDQLMTRSGVVIEVISCRIVNDDQPFGVVLSILDGAGSGERSVVFSRQDDEIQESHWTGEIHPKLDQVLRATFIGVESGTVCDMYIGIR